MSARIAPVTIATAPEGSRPVLEGLKKAIGMVPNIYATVAHSPAALKGYLAFSETLGAGKLSKREAELLALHVSELNGCSYCLSAHTALASRAGASAEEAAAAREGQSSSPRERAIFSLARRLIRTGGARAGRAILRPWTLAPPPTSRKLAGSPPHSLRTSRVAMASPAPLTRQPIEPVSLM